MRTIEKDNTSNNCVGEMCPLTYFPLRWESTGDQWWYACPIDWAAANGHYDLVRELIRLDANHLIKLTSLRRIRRLETVWDDEEQFDHVAKCRGEVARKLFSECEIKKSRMKNSLIGGGYGGWLLYTAASAGDLNFVGELLHKDPLLVFGEGEYGVTDMLYAAARSKDTDVFRLVLDFAASPRFPHITQIPRAYKLEIMNRAIHAAARGGNLRLLNALLRDCTDDALAYRDAQGATLLHAAAARGQLLVVKDLTSSSSAAAAGLINSTDNEGNTALHVAAHRGHLGVVETLIVASPSLMTATNNAGDTFLHSVISGFQTPGFRRLDRQIHLLKHLITSKAFNLEHIINAKNKDGKTALHLAITCNIHSHLVELLMTVVCIDLNIRDADGMTPLDILRQRPHSASSELLTRHLMSAGGIFTSQDYSARKVIASHIKRQSMGSSPGTSFRISDVDIFLYTGLENASDGSRIMGGLSTNYSPEVCTHESNIDNCSQRKSNKLGGSMNTAAQRLKRLLHWPKAKNITSDKLKKMVDGASLEEVPVPLRQRFSTLSSNHKRALSVSSSNQPSPTAKKKLASGVTQVVPKYPVSHRSRSSSFSKMSFSSQSSTEIGKANEDGGAKSSTQRHSLVNNKRSMNQYLCFGGAPTSDVQQPYDVYERSVLSAA